MSFSYNIKSKLCDVDAECEFCKIAELYGILGFSASERRGGISIITENRHVTERVKKLFDECVGFVPSESEYAGGYRLDITDETSVDLLSEKFHFGESLSLYSDEMMPFDCCKLSYLRGAFLGGGSVSDPKKNYHLEFAARSAGDAENLKNVIAGRGMEAKITERKSYFVVYLKGYEDIAAVMGLIGAGGAAMEIYNASIEKEIRNDINRRMNCESANIDKTARAYVKHVHAIEKIAETIGIEALPDTLAEIARVRIEYPDESLKALGEKLSPPLGKSGVNHRLDRILKIAEKL